MAEAEDEPVEELDGALDEGNADAGQSETGEGEADPPVRGPGGLSRALSWLWKWHPVLFLGAAAVLAAFAWNVYPRQAERAIPPAEGLYREGLDRLGRVLNPDLPLIAATPADEALAARNAFLNLFVFHRANLHQYPQFINPHLLLAESNRILAQHNPAMADKYLADAGEAYADAALWELREDSAENLAVYVEHNFLGGPAPGSARGATMEETLDFFAGHEDEIAFRRARRTEYIRFRQAEIDIHLGKPELARPVLEGIRRGYLARRREQLRRAAAGEPADDEPPRRQFELGPDDYSRLDFLLARAYDQLGLAAEARAGFLRYLSQNPDGRNQTLVMERLAALAMGDGEQYFRIDPDTARKAFASAAGYFDAIAASPSAAPEQRQAAVLGSATANSRLADLVQVDGTTGIDRLTRFGRALAGVLESFSGQPLPRRAGALPLAVGRLLSDPGMLVPGPRALEGAAGGTLIAMAGGAMTTPYERRRAYLSEALIRYDKVALEKKGTEQGDRAAVMAARESRRLGLTREAEARFRAMLDPLSSPDLVLAARMGLAAMALDGGDAERANLYLLGGYAQRHPLWFSESDADWRRIAAVLGNPANRNAPGVWLGVWEALPPEGRDIAAYAASGRRLGDEYVGRFLRAMNTLLPLRDLYRKDNFPPNNRNAYLSHLLDRNPESLGDRETIWRNRLLIEEALPYELSQKASKDVAGFPPLPPADGILPGGLVGQAEIRALVVRLAEAWTARAADAADIAGRLRASLAAADAYRAALDRYRGDQGQILFDMARNFENLAEIRETQGRHMDALSLTAEAARAYLDVSFRDRGSPREMEALLAAGDAFFRAGLLERTVESQHRFMDRFGYASLPGSETAMAVVRAENLLGRAYWFLNDSQNAIASFTRNIPRRTPDRYKSIYYIGRILMEEGMAENNPALLGDLADPLPALDRNGDPVLTSALQAFTYLRQSPGINPYARAWRWSTFDLGRLRSIFANRARKEWEEAAAAAVEGEAPPTAAWLALHDEARRSLTESLERYPLNGNGGPGLSVRVEPEDFADVMAARFETEFLLAQTLLVLSEYRDDESLAALARAHLANLMDRNRYANALFNPTLDKFQLNSAIVREVVEGGAWDGETPLPRSRLGDDEGPTHSPQRLGGMLRNAIQLLAAEYLRAGDRLAAGGNAGEAGTFFRRAHQAYQELYDRFGPAWGSLAMVGMGDALVRLGRPDEAANHYRMAKNIAAQQPPDARSDGLLDIGPAFWSRRAADRLRDQDGGFGLP